MVELIWEEKKVPSITATDRIRDRLITQCIYPPSSQQSITAVTLSNEWHNRLIQADRLAALNALLPDFAERVNLIYIDPPFMTGRTFTNGAQLRSTSHISYHDIWNNNLDAYLQWIYETFHYLYRLLATNGSIYVHLDWRAAHYAKLILDEIFSQTRSRGAGFKNEIIWHYQSGGRAKRAFARKHDTILLYTKSSRYTFHSERVSIQRGTSKRNHMRQAINVEGKIIWSIRSNGRIYTYTQDSTMSLADVWNDISHLHQRDPERTGYATQKPEALLERILLASSEPDDLVLDCFCGSGVTPSIAERLGRRWIAIDKNETAVMVTRERLLKVTRMHPFAMQYVSEEE